MGFINKARRRLLEEEFEISFVKQPSGWVILYLGYAVLGTLDDSETKISALAIDLNSPMGMLVDKIQNRVRNLASEEIYSYNLDEARRFELAHTPSVSCAGSKNSVKPKLKKTASKVA